MAALREVVTVLGWTFANVIGFVSARTVRLVQVEAHRVVGLVETAPAARSSTVALFTDSIQPTGHLVNVVETAGIALWIVIHLFWHLWPGEITMHCCSQLHVRSDCITELSWCEDGSIPARCR